MSPQLAIFLLLCSQIGIYILLDKLHVPEVKYVALLLVWAVNVFVLPWTGRAEAPVQDGAVACGMPVLRDLLSFWIVGSVCIVITHVLYVLARKGAGDGQHRSNDTYSN